jgi:dTDP-4-dehydrorhamnose 3,5-epimerase
VNAESLAIPDVKLLTPARFHDARGFFSETWNAARFAAVGVPGPFIQDNHALSRGLGVVRGLHLQIGPNAQGKLVRVVRGAIWDVAVDLRPASPTYLQWHGERLSADNGRALLIPEGFAHGFQTFSADCVLLYLHSAPYHAAAEAGLRFDDPALGIAWPLPVTEISERDQQHPLLSSTFSGVVLP